ncbi:RNA polymerase sigma factor FliA [Paludibacterium yongneupense]|uniref:RNA polymerase sigma factor FliA n=1 Tax=Paludibacterium yongneupense TaxID=400061 RepID=UPI00040C2924|nr:RNA polymerase sigma factor FliA [Paludibacterium yongneupense]
MIAGSYKRSGYLSASGEIGIDVTEYVPLVKKLAGILVARLPASIDIDDMVQVGVIGLIDAARQFDPGQGVQFETFASQRVRGAMLDELRRQDWMPRHVRRQARQIEEAVARLEHRLGHAPLDSEIAAEMNLSLDAYQDALGDCKGMSLLHFEDFGDADEGVADALANIIDPQSPDPLGTLADSGFRQDLIAAIGQLPERDRLVMALYYEQDLNLKEIGAVLGVSESRVSQLHTQAIVRLRAHLRDWL